jgi:hypothetical protein
MHRTRIVHGALVCTAIAVAFLIPFGAQSNGRHTMKTIPPLFETIQLGRMEESACTPPLGGWDYRGIKLNAPTKNIIREEFVLPLCGSWQFSDKFINKFKNIHTEIVIVVTDMKTFKSYSGNLRTPGFEYKENRKAVGTDEELEENTAASWFNIDIYDYVRDLPQKPGKYLIYALVGDVKSNVVEVEIEIEKGAKPGPRSPRPM